MSTASLSCWNYANHPRSLLYDLSPLHFKNLHLTKLVGDYCDVYLTHDSMSVRKAHNSGRNHLRNVVDYYQRTTNPYISKESGGQRLISLQKSVTKRRNPSLTLSPPHTLLKGSPLRIPCSARTREPNPSLLQLSASQEVHEPSKIQI